MALVEGETNDVAVLRRGRRWFLFWLSALSLVLVAVLTPPVPNGQALRLSYVDPTPLFDASPFAPSPPIEGDQTAFELGEIETEPFFQPNAGRFGDEVDLVLAAGERTVTIGAGSFSVAAHEPAHEVTLTFIGADPSVEPTMDRTSGPPTNYFIGNDPDQWLTNVRPAGAAEYTDLIGRTDVRFLAVEDGFRFDVQVEPGSDPASVMVDAGDADLWVEEDGSLTIDGGSDDPLVLSSPDTYQETPQGRVGVPSSFVLRDDNTFGFEVGEYDPSLPLIIDPTLDLSTYIGGVAEDNIHGVDLDASGNIVVVGSAVSSDYPTTTGAYDETGQGISDIVVTKLSEDGASVLWSTYIGGDSTDEGLALRVSSDGSIYVSGSSDSSDFPTTGGAYDTSKASGDDAVVLRVSSDGASLLASTYFGGNAGDFGSHVEIDSGGAIVVGFGTQSTDFPTTVGAFDTTKEGATSVYDSAVAKFDATLTTLTWSTMLGGSGDDHLEGVQLDSSDEVYLLIETSDTGLPTSPGAFDTTQNGGVDLWLSRLDASASTLGYGTYLGGPGDETGEGALAVASVDRVYLANSAQSGFPTTGNAMYPAATTTNDTVFALIDPTATGSAQLLHSTFLGGSDFGYAEGIAVDDDGRAFVVGDANATGLATADATQGSKGSGNDGLLSVIDPYTGAFDFVTYVGGSGDDILNGIVLDSAENPIVVGQTAAGNLPTTAGAFQTTSGGGIDGFVVRITGIAGSSRIVVNSTGDSGDASAGDDVCTTGATNSQGQPECTLRAAIQEANGLPGFDVIQFDIPQTETGYVSSPQSFRIRPSSLLPEISTAMSIDGSSQPEFATNGRPVIEIDGQNVSAGEANGLWITGGGTTIRGLVINDFGDDAIDVEFLGGNTIVGNYVGTDVTGTIARPNAWGVNLKTPGNVVGGASVADRNVISGNTNEGVYIKNAAAVGNVVQGNYVGTDAAGTGPVPNGSDGVIIFSSASSTQIGGTGPGEGNVIAGNADHGININSSGSSSTNIEGNHIGVNAAGTSVVANGADGINITAGADNTSILGNLVAHPNGHGINVAGSSSGSVIQGNTIGTDLTEAADWSGRFAAVNLENGASNTLIGGGGAGEGNVLANGGSNATNPNNVSIWGDAGSGISVIGNDIYGSRGLGIDLDPLGVTPNDAGDGDNGPNGLLNFPDITAASSDGSTTLVTFDLDVPANADQYRVEFFTNASGPNLGGSWEGERFVAAMTTSPGTGLTHAFAGPGGDVLTATATRIDSGATSGYSSTSEFSASEVVVSPIVRVNSTGDAPDATPGDDSCDTGATNSQGYPECTLRAALDEANVSALVDAIHFAIPTTETGHSGGVWTIGPGSQLPGLGQTVSIDGTTQPGWTTTPVIEIDGTSAGGTSDGLRVLSSGSEIRGLAINRFGADGIEVDVSAGTTSITANHIGLDATGLIDRGNGARGIDLQSSSGPSTVGGTAASDRNVISGNGDDGIVIYASNSMVFGNYIGTDVTGLLPMPNGSDGIGLSGGASGNTIGTPGAQNVISGNVDDGIEIADASPNNIIQANAIGLGADGSTPVPNGRYGVVLYNGANNNRIGGGAPGEGNVISANTRDGIHIDGNDNAATTANSIEGNYIGTDATGTLDRGNVRRGIYVRDGATATVIGSTGAGNTISGNGDDGVRLEAAGTDNTVIQGNHLGTNATGDGAIPNDARGLQIESGASFTQVGGATAGEGNVISGNVSDGVAIADWLSLGTTGTVVEGNLIGVEADGLTPLGNGGHGVQVDPVTGNRIGGATPGAGNVIANNGATGVQMAPTSGTNTVLGNSIYANADIGLGLGWDGVTLNDGGDGDSGPNDLLNFPAITAATESGSNVSVEFDLDVPAGDYRIEIFTNPSGADGTGYGEGELFETAYAIVAHPGGVASYTTSFAGGTVGDIVTATTTEQSAGPVYGATSEFSAAHVVVAPCTDSDLDGLCDVEEDANADADNDPTTSPGPDTDGDANPNYLDADDDGDGTPTAAESADPNGDGDPRDARDTDRDGQPDYLDIEAGRSTTPVADEQKISDLAGGLTAPLDDSDSYGGSIAGIGDVDGDGVNDFAVGAYLDDDGGADRGAVYVLFMNADGTVKAEQKISDTAGGLTATPADGDWFGVSVGGVGDLDGDGVNDIVAGAYGDDDGGSDRGAAYVLLLNADGTVKAEQKISDTQGGLAAPLADVDYFGLAVAGVGDVNADGVNDVVVGAYGDDDGGSGRGAIYVLLLNADGTVKAEQKISDSVGGLTATLDDFASFGGSVAGLGDVDGDGVVDIAVGAYGDGGGGNSRGAVFVLLLNADGTVKAEQKISDTAGGLTAALADFDWFGFSVAGLGDVDGDGVADMVAGAPNDDDGGNNRGAVFLLLLNADGSVKSEQKISDLEGGLTASLTDSDWFGFSLASVGDLDGDGSLNFAVGAPYDDDGGTDRGAVYVLDLAPFVFDLVVNSTGDASDLAPGDGVCDTGGTNAIALAECTFRASIEEANASGSTAIAFDIPFADAGQVSGVWTMNPSIPFDDIVVPVTIDGSTQASWISTPVIEIDGTSAGAAADGLHLAVGSDGSLIRSLAIGNFAGNALHIESDNDRVVGNHLGIDASGTSAAPTGAAIIFLQKVDDNVIGGSSSVDRNIIGAGAGGVVVEGGSGSVISGNFIGTDVTGTIGLSGVVADGIRVGNGAIDTQVGGPTAAEGNLIGNTGDDGIQVDGSATVGTIIQNNSVGVTLDGLAGFNIPDDGLSLSSAGSMLISDNVIGNADSDGIRIGGTTTGIVIRANSIGTNSAQSVAHFVGSVAINIPDLTSDLMIGGAGTSDGNHISMGPNPSPVVNIGNPAANDIAVLGNTVDSDFIVIDLGADGPTANDALDVDSGANDLLNHPVLAVTDTTGSGPFTVDLEVALDAPAGDYRIEIYSNSEPGISGAGGAEELAHVLDITHTGSGDETFATSFVSSGSSNLSATATEDLGAVLFGSTSEMSPSAVVGLSFTVNSTGDTGDTDLNDGLCLTGSTTSEGAPECTFRAALDQANRGTGSTIEFAIPVSDPGRDADGFWAIVQGFDWPDLFGQGLTIDGSSQPGFLGSGPVIHLVDDGSGGDTLDLRADDISISDLAATGPGDDAVQARGQRQRIDGLWLGVDPNGVVIESSGSSSEGITIDAGSNELVVLNSRIAGFNAAVVTGSGTVDATITGSEIFENRNGGIDMDDDGRITLLGNSIHDNGGLAFEIGVLDGTPMPNDVGDGDTGPNDLLNHPVLTGTTVGVGTVDVDYTIDVPAGTYRIEFFDSDRPDPTGFGEGQTFLSADSILHPGGSATFTATVVATGGDVITATATPELGSGSYGGTSEFSNAKQIGIVFVNSTGDAGDLATGDGTCDTGAVNADGNTECTLRAAIQETTASPDVDLIHFQIPEADTGLVTGSPDFWIISPATALPAIVDASVDASTQPGWEATPLIQLDGAGAAVTEVGLAPGLDVTVRGFSLTAWQDGLTVGADGTAVQASWFGVAPDGSIAVNRASDAVVYGSPTNLTFGGPDDVDGNVFAAGGTFDGLVLNDASSSVLIENNHFGVAADGVSPLGSVVAELLIIGDDTVAVTVRDNQFVGSPDAAIVVFGNPDDIDIVDNIFGTDVTGTVDLGVSSAVYADTTGSFRFGGPGAGDGNLVRNAAFDAIVVAAGHTGTATVLGNSIANSGGLAFDIAGDGPDTNDAGDTVVGPNGTLNHPEILDVVGSGGLATVRFQLDVAAGNYRIEAFANPSGADPSGHGEGELFVGAIVVAHGGGGNQTFELDVAVPAGAPVSLTATVDLGAGFFGPTSEYSAVAVPISAAVVEDISIRQTDLTASGGIAPAVPAVGIGGDGINIDGGSERLVGPPTDISANELTMSAWVKLDAAGNDPRILSKGLAAGAIYELFIDDATAEAVGRIDVGGGLVEARGGSVPAGSWHHVVATWNGITLTLYVDGVSVDAAAASGTLTVDLDEPLIIGNNRTGTAGLNGTVDQIELQHRSMPLAEVLARSRNGASPSAFVTIGGEQTAAPAPWATSAVQSRTGGNALAAPTTTPGADAWITAIGLDEPGVEITAWWWISDPTANVVSAGTRTGPIPTDQFDAAANGTGLDLGVISGATRTSAANTATMLASGTWQQVVMSTDELGVTSFRLDGITRIAPTLLSGPTSGSVGFRASDIDPGQQWFIDDVRVRMLVSDEPTTSLGPIERN